MRKVLITGSSRGIGEAVARKLVKSGYDVLLHGKSKSDKLVSLADELRCKYVYFDVGDENKAREILSKFQDAFYAIVLNAGITADATFAGLDSFMWHSVVNTNLNSFYNILHPLIMPMARAKLGRIVVISSVSGIIGNRGQSNYAASKAGLIGAAKSLAIELASRNITVNVVAPGLIQTDMISDDLPLEDIKKLIPSKRFGKPEEVAGIVNFLLSDEAGYITKQVIGVNGGMA